MQGKLIVIEGLDGSGKSTQWEMLKNVFKRAYFLTFPDYESESGKIVKRYLNGEFEGSSAENSAYSASSFYAIDRYISCKTSWGALYRSGTNIISARYTSSNGIYQMTKLPKSDWSCYLDWLYDFEHGKLEIPRPDLTVFLDVPIEISQELLTKRYSQADCKSSKDIHEGDVDYLNKCREAALFVAKRDGWIVVDCVESGKLRLPADINRELSAIIEKELEHD